MTKPPLKLLPHAALVCVILAIAAWSGVSLRDALAYLAFCAAFVFLPGLALYFALWPGRAFSLRAVAIGPALGFVMETAAYQLTAQMGARPAFAFYPILACAVCGFIIWRTRPRPTPPAPPDGGLVIGLLALGSLLLLVYFVFAFFLPSPLPGTVSGVTYFVDYPYFIGLSAEALHHWPVTDPHIAGTPLSYYLNQFLDMAAAAQVFDIPLPVIALRLYIFPLIVLLPIQYFALGKAATGKNAIGLLVVALGLFLGEADLDLREPTLFGNWGIGYLHISGSYALGLVMALALFILLVETAKNRDQTPLQVAALLIAITLLLVGQGGTKATALLVMAGGLAAYLALGFITRQNPPRRLILISGWSIAVFAFLYVFIYREMNTTARLAPFAAILRSPGVAAWQARFGQIPAPLFAAGASVLGLIGFAPAHVAGVAALLFRPKLLLQNILPLGIFGAGLGAFLLFDYANYAQIVFLYYAMPAACVLAALGLMELWQAVRRAKPIARFALAAPALACIFFAALDAPFDARLNFTKWRTGQPVYTPSAQLTPGMYAAYTWLRQNTSPDDVIAVNNPLVDKTIYILPSPHNFYASAFAERRVFLEGWAYSSEAHRLGYKDAQTLRVQPYPERKALNDRVFAQADAPALAALRDQFGVRYLFVDKLNAPPSPGLSAISQMVFENGDAAIYKVAAP